MRRLTCCLLAVAGLVIASPSSAHPLGNFTVNHLAKVRIHGEHIAVRYVLDIAEIPTFQIMRARSAAAQLSAAQLSQWALSEIPAVLAGLHVESDGRQVSLATAGQPRVMTRPGAGGLPTLYWSADLHGGLPPARGKPRTVLVNDRTFADRIGWKDIAVYPGVEPTHELLRYPSALLASPRDVTQVIIIMSARGARVSVLEQPTVNAGGAASQARSNTLSDMLAKGPSSVLYVLLTLLVAIGLGALHAMEPGHGKTLLAVSLVGARASVKQAVILAGALTFAHTAGVVLLGIALLSFAAWIVPENVYPWITLASGVTIAWVGAASLARFVRARRGESRHRGESHHGEPHHHDHAHAHDHAHDHGHPYDHEHPHAHGQPASADQRLSFVGVVLAAASGNIAPCPAALVVLLAALTLHRLAFGLAIVVAFSIGLAATLTGLGIAVVRGARWVSGRPTVDRIADWAPLASGCAIAVLGALMLGKGAALTAFHAPALGVTLLALAAIASYALLPGHVHAGHTHATVGSFSAERVRPLRQKG